MVCSVRAGWVLVVSTEIRHRLWNGVDSMIPESSAEGDSVRGFNFIQQPIHRFRVRIGVKAAAQSVR